MKEHIQEVSKIVGSIGVYAGVSVADIDFFLRTAVGLVTIVYIVCKTIHVVKHWNDKPPAA